MIIRTTNQTEIEVAAGLKQSLRRLGVEVFIIPPGVSSLWVTIVDLSGDNSIVVYAENEETNEILDTTIGFDSCDEAYAYARKIAFAAGLNEDCVDGDVWDQVSDEIK